MSASNKLKFVLPVLLGWSLLLAACGREAEQQAAADAAPPAADLVLINGGIYTVDDGAQLGGSRSHS